MSTIDSERATFADEAHTRYLTKRPTLRVTGMLSPVDGQFVRKHPLPFCIDADEFLIGRENQVNEESSIVLAEDESVSRRHARILRIGHEFVLEDLDSLNGTYVDGVPIVKCTLRDGDTIQIGRSLFCFGRSCEFCK